MTSCERPPQGHQVVGPLPRAVATARGPSTAGGTPTASTRRSPATPARRARGARRRPRDARRFVTKTWAPTYAVTLAPKTRQHYATSTTATSRPSSAASASAISRRSGSPAGRRNGSRPEPDPWLSGRRSTCSAAPAAGVRGERIATNPVRLVRRLRDPAARSAAASPATVEAMRAAASLRDATLLPCSHTPVSGRARRWRSAGTTSERRRSSSSAPCRSARTTTPRRTSTARCGSSRRCVTTSSCGAIRPGEPARVPWPDGGVWPLPAYQSWRRRAFRRAVAAPGIGTRRRTRSGTPSPRCSCTRAERHLRRPAARP